MRTSFEKIVTTSASDKRAKDILELSKLVSTEIKVIAISGESGSGKSSTGLSILNTLEARGKKSAILHMDNYFKDVPHINDQKRREDLSGLGKAEIDLEKLQANVDQFIKRENPITIPILNEMRDEFVLTEKDFSDVDVLIVEGTFVLELCNVDLKVFLDVSPEQSKNRRIQRGRDKIDEFIELVIEKESELIKPYQNIADIVFDQIGMAYLNGKK